MDLKVYININDKIKVKLTEHGKNIFNNRYNQIYEKHPEIKNILINTPVEVDSEGYSEFQLWEFMNIFGSHLYNGCNQILENNLIIYEVGYDDEQ